MTPFLRNKHTHNQELQRGDIEQSAASAGSLSGLFRRVVTVCQNQFAVIGKVFPPPLVAKVTRLLLSRILNDPVYGVQVRACAYARVFTLVPSFLGGPVCWGSCVLGGFVAICLLRWHVRMCTWSVLSCTRLAAMLALRQEHHHATCLCPCVS